ncbi:hypothetical protein C0992_005219 [Termitomyces sp. T32_za158]|nr:hypothetical protein C0992_005219 [Termitomyces sp. T32_za158]
MHTGQERFSSLSKAFFRDADAALLMFDVNTPETLTALTKWWAEFREQAPLADEDMEDFCCVVVGNKTDVDIGEGRVKEREAATFLTELVPPMTSPSASLGRDDSSATREGRDTCHLSPSNATTRPSEMVESLAIPHQAHNYRSDSIVITSSTQSKSNQGHSTSRSPAHNLSKSSSRSSSQFYSGTMTTTHTTLTLYHTPSSSLFDVYQSACSSPEPRSSPCLSPSSLGHSLSPYSSTRGRPLSTFSNSTHSTSSGSIATITPSLFAREHSGTNTVPRDDDTYVSFPPPPARGPKLFFTSAKTGAGVPEVFEYIARRVVRKWEYEERLKAQRMHMRDSSAGDTVQISLLQKNESARTACCSS